MNFPYAPPSLICVAYDRRCSQFGYKQYNHETKAKVPLSQEYDRGTSFILNALEFRTAAQPGHHAHTGFNGAFIDVESGRVYTRSNAFGYIHYA
jgi:hypothetical protein